MNDALKDFIMDTRFPCIMAKGAFNNGMVNVLELDEHDFKDEKTLSKILSNIYTFIDNYRRKKKLLSSFIIILKNDKYMDFKIFQSEFWSFLEKMRIRDRQHYKHDPRVSSNPDSNNFSYSLKEEAFFILTLHPESPRFARRFQYPAIIFNPHQQFERLKKNGLFNRIQKTIRARDKVLQGFINPMLTNFGTRSEVFQYTGTLYSDDAISPLKPL